LNALAELVCGVGYRVDWTAISSIATTAAVFVALWIPTKERRARRLERLEAEARAAALVSQSLSGLLEVMPRAVGHIKEKRGVMIDAPGNDVLYGIDVCQEVIEKEAYVHQLPTAYLGAAELTVSLARSWCRQIETRIETQRNEALRQPINWRSFSFVFSLGTSLHKSAVQLRQHCAETQADYDFARKHLLHRMASRIRNRKSRTINVARQDAPADATEPRT